MDENNDVNVFTPLPSSFASLSHPVHHWNCAFLVFLYLPPLLLPAHQSLGVFQLSFKKPDYLFISCSASLRMTPRCVPCSAISFQNPTALLTIPCFISCKCFNSECASHGIHQLLSQTSLPYKTPDIPSWCLLLVSPFSWSKQVINLPFSTPPSLGEAE